MSVFKKLGILILVSLWLWPLASQAVVLPASYPRLANYFLRWEITDAEAEVLAKWDLLILDMEVQENSRLQLERIRALNPQIIILAYLTSQEIIADIDDYQQAYLRQELRQEITEGWWLKDNAGQKISNWPETWMLNLSDGALLNSSGQRFNDYLPEFVVNKLQSTGLWDGVFYDNTWGDVAWVNNSNLDLNNDGVVESRAEADQLWSSGFKKMLAKTRALAGPEFIIIGNGRVYDGYQGIINGMMLESFPSSWENGGTWSGSMKTYFKLPTLNAKPSLPVINIYDKSQTNYRHVRFGLASTLLGDGFFSYDYDVTNHGQTWWYDEYDFDLGPVRSQPYNLLARSSSEIKPGLWRRDFKNGIALINSTDQTQNFLFSKEEFEKLKGDQDPLINSGQRINYLKLASRDGVILIKRNQDILNTPFTNGYFYRIFNQFGSQVRGGFFAYSSFFPGTAEVILIGSGSGEANGLSLNAAAGQINLTHNDKRLLTLKPYNLFKNNLSLAADFSSEKVNIFVVGAGSGGGPQVRVFAGSGRVLSSFFAYDKNLRGGVNVALGDVDGDGELEIITGPGQGTEPRIKIFSLAGELKTSFLAYDAKFQGGVNVALGDVDGDGELEIITGPGLGGGPQVRIFNQSGQVQGSFFAYDQNFHGGIKVSASDINSDDQAEILVGLKNFY